MVAALLTACTQNLFEPTPTGPDASTLPEPDAADATGSTPPPDPRTVGLAIDPENVALVTNGVTPARQAFVVEALMDDGTRTDVSADARFTLSDPIGTVQGAEFESALHGGQATLTASLGSYSVSADIRVTLSSTVVASPPDGTDPVPAEPGELFTGPADPTRAPALVYPNDGVLLPPNLGRLEVHFRPTPETSLYEIAFTSSTADVRIYTRCAPLEDGCVYEVDPASWRALADTHRGESGVHLTVRGTDDEGSAVGTSARFDVNFAFRDVVGGLYYWTTSDGTGIMRVEFGSGEAPERFFPFSGSGCFGCHALSRDGQRMSLSMNGQRDGRVMLIDVGGEEIVAGPQDDFREQFQSWAPDSRRFVGIYGDGNPVDTNLRIRDGETGEVLETIPVGVEASHPDWSSDGSRIVFTEVTRHQTSQRPGRGAITYVEELPAGGWTAPARLVPAEDGANRYYPAFAPGAELLVYNESLCPNGEVYASSCDADADPVAKLWALPRNGGTPIFLDQVNAPGVADDGETDLSNTFPKWAPFIDQRTQDGGRVMWFTFSSRRAYGLRSPAGSGQLLWMVALDPDAVLRGDDGSFAPFALPFQDLTTSNHIAQWTTRVVDNPDPDGGTDPGGRNDGGVCLNLGSLCDPAASDCCPGLICGANGPSQFVCRPDI